MIPLYICYFYLFTNPYPSQDKMRLLVSHTKELRESALAESVEVISRGGWMKSECKMEDVEDLSKERR